MGNNGSYTELRVQDVSSHTIRMVNGAVRENRRTASLGASARSFLRGKWGFASSSYTDAGSLGVLQARASENAELLGGHSTGKLFELPAYPGKVNYGFQGEELPVSAEKVSELFSYI